jgi:hypothetical protein
MALFGDGYGDVFGLTSSEMAGQNQVLTQWSGQILRLGMDQLVFPRFLSLTPPGIVMGMGKGQTFRIPIFTWIEQTAGTTALTSGTTIPLLDQGTLNVYGTLDEYGRGIGMENTLDYFTKLDNGAALIETLANNRSRVINELARSVIHATPHNVVLGTAGTTGTTRIGVTGAATHSAVGTLSGEHMKNIRDFLRSKRVPTYANGLYTVIGNANAFRGLKNEGVFEQYNYYNNPGINNGLVYQILGNWEGFTFVETEEGMDQGGTLKYFYVVAPEVGAQAYAKPISLYYYPDVNRDANRLNVIKWHMIAGFAQTLRDYGTRALKCWYA